MPLICHKSLVSSVTLIYPVLLSTRCPAFSLCPLSIFCHSPLLCTGCNGALRGLQQPHRSGLGRDSLVWAAAATRQSSSVFRAPYLAALVLRLCAWPSVACWSWYHCCQCSFLLLGPPGIPRVCMSVAGGEGRWVYRGSWEREGANPSLLLNAMPSYMQMSWAIVLQYGEINLS